MKNWIHLKTTKFPAHWDFLREQHHHSFPFFHLLSNTSILTLSDFNAGQKIFTMKGIRMSFLLNVWIKAMRLKEVSWHSSGLNSSFFVFADSLVLGPCLFLDNLLLFDMLGLSQVWSSNQPTSYSPQAAPTRLWAQWLSVLGSQASREWPAHFVNLTPDIKFLIIDTKFSLLGDLKMQAPLFVKTFYFHWKAPAKRWPHFTVSDPCFLSLLNQTNA